MEKRKQRYNVETTPATVKELWLEIKEIVEKSEDKDYVTLEVTFTNNVRIKQRMGKLDGENFLRSHKKGDKALVVFRAGIASKIAV